MARLLVLGGTSFVGRTVVEQALAQGDEVTLFTRGITNPHLFPEAEHVVGDRDGGLGALPNATWDLVVDTSGYVPRVVADSVRLLAPKVAWYSFVSSLAVYADLSPAGVTEDAPLAPPPDPPSEDRGPYYGPLKVMCEEVVAAALGDRSTITRCSLIVGPNDPTGRFTYWLDRVAEGGPMLAPGDPATPMQFIDVRDLGDWLLGSASTGAAGAFNAAGPSAPFTMGDFLQAAIEVTGGVTELQWCDDATMLAAGAAPYFAPPLWVPGTGPMAGLTAVDCAKGVAAGMTFRPPRDTVADTWAWTTAQPPSPPSWPRAEEERILGQRM